MSTKSLMNVHKNLQKERLKREIMKEVEKNLTKDVVAGMKAVFLLALRKEGWGRDRAMRLIENVNSIEQALLEGSEGGENGINWNDIYNQVEEEYKISLLFDKGEK